MEETTIKLLESARKAVTDVAKLTSEEKNEALRRMAAALVQNKDSILIENAVDIENARGRISDVMIDRLRLTEGRIRDMADGIRQVADLPDPVFSIDREYVRDDGLIIRKVRVPLGVIAIIYESRPNVTSDAAALAFKSGNVCVLRGGKESYRSSAAIVSALKDALRESGISADAIGLVSDLTHESANTLMEAVGLVDLLIPRGGAGLIKRVTENAKVPCIQTGSGICHVYIDKSADIGMALNIVNNAKTSRPSVCNAEEVCLVHEDIARKFLPLLKTVLVDDREEDGLPPVELRLDAKAAAIIPGTPAGENDFDTEFLDYILAVKVVGSTQEAVDHIREHSTGHSEAIVTQSQEDADLFVRDVDSSSVYVNASTRFTDGGEFGLGCEMGISTQKLHARGPMGLTELTTYKYIINGNGHIR